MNKDTLFFLHQDLRRPSKIALMDAYRSCMSYTVKKYPCTFSYSKKNLYHYTDINGLIGMVKSKGFWLSDARFLNDGEELINGANISIDIIRTMLRFKCYSIFHEVLYLILTKLECLDLKHVYVCSFSLEKDSLEQWRAYGKNGSGICIEFDTTIKTSYPHFQIMPQYQLQKIIYDDETKVDIVKHIFRSYYIAYKKDSNNFSPDKIKKDYVDSIISQLSYFYAIFKNSAFSSEKEARIVDDCQKIDFYNQINYRTSNGLIVPYVCTYDTKLKDSNSIKMEPDNLPIRRIIIGPTTAQEATKRSVENFLDDMGYDDQVKVVISRVPFRG